VTVSSETPVAPGLLDWPTLGIRDGQFVHLGRNLLNEDGHILA
jgi:hypothetical protein